MNQIKVLALPKYGNRAASMRQRLQQYLPTLEREGCAIEVMALLDNSHICRINQGRNAAVWQTVSAYARRIQVLHSARNYDAIWLHYESFPYLPSFAERLVFLYGKPVILDFDDAIFHQYDNHRNSLVRRWLGKKLQPLIRRSAICAAGNAYLADYARQFCSDVRILPTVVDTSLYKPELNREAGLPITIGWIGTPSTWNFVKPLVPLLQRLAERPNVSVKIIGAGHMEAPPEGLQFVEWSEDREISDIQSMDIGIMPLPDEPWARGKCGYKLIQYMACGLPVVASPVGVNSTIVEHGCNGYLADNLDEFSCHIEKLIGDAVLRTNIGAAGRKKVESYYSLKTHAPRFLQIVKDAVVNKCAA